MVDLEKEVVEEIFEVDGRKITKICEGIYCETVHREIKGVMDGLPKRKSTGFVPTHNLLTDPLINYKH